MLGPELRLSQAIEHDCIELCARNGLTGQGIRIAIHIADDLARRASLSSIEVMQTDEFWQYIGIQRRTVIDASDILRKKVISAIKGKVTPTIAKGWQAQLDRIRVALNAALEELDDNEGDPRTCIEYALGQLRRLGLFGGLKE